MQHKNNIYLKVLILLTFMMQTASATMDYILTYYIPVASELDSSLMVKDGMRLHKAMVYIYYSEPESAISSITQKYLIYTPHKEKEADYMRDYNVNLAYIKGLKVNLFDYGSKECRVVMDSSKLVFDYDLNVLEKILRYVRKATKLNMKEHNINCPFQEIKVKRVADSTIYPKALELGHSAFVALSKYASGSKGMPYLNEIFYPLGYSDDGKLAYVKEYDTDPADMVLIRTFIQDLVTDKMLWQDEYRVEENITNIDFKSFWRERQVKINNKLKKYAIKPFKNLKFEPNWYIYKNNSFDLDSKSKSTFHKDWGMNFLDSSVIMLGTKNLGMKTIDRKVYKDEQIIARKAIGFIPLGSSERVAVVVANVYRGWEGPPHNLSYDIVGASLRVGFKR